MHELVFSVLMEKYGLNEAWRKISKRVRLCYDIDMKKEYNCRKKTRKKHIYNLMITFLVTIAITMIVGILGIILCASREEEKTVIEFLVFETDNIVKNFTEGDAIALTDALPTSEENGEWFVETKKEDEVTLLFAGDVLLDDHYAVMSTLKSNGTSIENAFSDDLIAEMQNADIFMVNNEFTYTTRGEPIEGKTYTFRANPSNVTVLQQMGVDIVSLANNHAYDYGEISLLDTLDTLDAAGIYHVGAGRNINEAAEVVYANAGGYRIAFVSATQIERNATPDTKGATEDTPGVFRCNVPDRLIETIQEAKLQSDFVVLYIHWGTESTTVLDELQKQQAPIYAQAGADIIIGDHAHCLQQIAYVDGVPVIYSLGNFWFNSKTQDTCLIKVTLNQEEGMKWQFLPCRQSGCKTTLLADTEKDHVISYMRSISPGVTITPEGYIYE